MLRYGLVDPSQCNAILIEASSFESALLMVGLNPGKVDHGNITSGLSIVVDEFSLKQTPQRYFAIGQGLYGGRALLYAHDRGGNTVSLRELPSIFWFGSDYAVEMAITAGQVKRPQFAVNGEVFWEWRPK